MRAKSIKLKYIFILLFFIFLLSIFIMLLRGINISDFKTDSVKISQLYIKLDKKLILKAKNIEFAKAGKKNQSFDYSLLAGLSTKIYFLNLLFETIELNTLKIGEKSILLNYDGNRLFVDTDELKASLSMQKQDNKHIDFIDIESLSLKDFDLNLKGIASIEALKERFAFSGEFKSYEITGKIDATLHFSELRYKIYDASASGIKEFMDAIELKTGLDSEIREWIDKNTKAKLYRIKSLSARANLKTKNFYLDEIKAKASADDVEVKFEKTLPSAVAKNVEIELKDSNLYFRLNNPKYKNHELNSSSLVIHDIFSAQAGLMLKIRTNALFDNDIKELLSAYDIDMPLIQKSGDLRSNLTLKIAFSPFNISTFGDFYTTNSELNIAGAIVSVKKADIKLNKDSKLLINADNVGLEFLEADIKSQVDINQKSATIQAQNLNLNIADVITLKNQKANASMQFDDNIIQIQVPKYGIDLTADTGIKIELNSSNVLDYFSLKDTLRLSDFNKVKIFSDDFKSYHIAADDVSFNLPLLLDRVPYDKASFEIEIKDGSINATSDDKKLKIEYKDGIANVWLDELNVDADALFLANSENSSDIILKISGKNSSLITKSGFLKFSGYELSKNGANINLSASPDNGGSVKLNKSASSWHLAASGLTALSINNLSSKDSFDEGSFDLVASGLDEKHFKGELNAKNTYLKDYVFYQRLLSFMDTIPSILSLKTPDFNEKGFKVNNGKVRFSKNGDELKFDAFYLSGTSSDLLGSGKINLKTDELDFTLELRFLKAVNNTIGQIPLIGHIIFGKDRSLSTVIKVNGTTSEPIYQTQMLTDTLLSPFKLIRNIISAPFNF